MFCLAFSHAQYSKSTVHVHVASGLHTGHIVSAQQSWKDQGFLCPILVSQASALHAFHEFFTQNSWNPNALQSFRIFAFLFSLILIVNDTCNSAFSHFLILVNELRVYVSLHATCTVYCKHRNFRVHNILWVKFSRG